MRRANRNSRSSISGLVFLGLLQLLAQSEKGHAEGRAELRAPVSAATRRSDDEALLKACEQSLACASHLERANKLYEQDSFTAALDEYQAAYILQPYPLILYNIARIHHKQASLIDAISYYQRYLDTGHLQRSERATQLLQKARQEQDEKDTQPEPPPAPLEVEPAPAPLVAPRQILRVEGSAKRPIYKKWSS